MASSQKVTFTGSSGEKLSARLDFPDGDTARFVLFAHCFTCSKDFIAARRIASGLVARGFAVLRFDFTGLGSSDGDFANTNFSSNVEDLLCAVDYLRLHFEAPAIMIGHSLGGTAVLEAAGEVPELKAVATIGAPAEAAHVAHNFLPHLDQIHAEGEAEVQLSGRKFTIRRQFLEDLNQQVVLEKVKQLRKPLLIFHSPLDDTVAVSNAAAIFKAAHHPKSYVSLETADHLLTDPSDAAYVADVITAWAARYVDAEEAEAGGEQSSDLVVSETLQGKFQLVATKGQHRLLIDEPTSVGGLDSGPSPYGYLAIALGGCTAMTLRLYAEHKGLDLGRISVTVGHAKVDGGHLQDADNAAEGRVRRIDRFERTIAIEGGTTPEVAAKLLQIADKCPVHRTLEGNVIIVTRVDRAEGNDQVTEV
jgi:uncharacterized OsmC-like protein/fermentation-respiration switch protein FrsA (DUF1100 family)